VWQVTWCKPNEGLAILAKKIGSHSGCNPNNNDLPKFWLCLRIGHANILVGLVGAQTKHTRTTHGFGKLTAMMKRC
jgi:hypothetical protein